MWFGYQITKLILSHFTCWFISGPEKLSVCAEIVLFMCEVPRRKKNTVLAYVLLCSEKKNSFKFLQAFFIWSWHEVWYDLQFNLSYVWTWLYFWDFLQQSESESMLSSCTENRSSSILILYGLTRWKSYQPNHVHEGIVFCQMKSGKF